MCCHFSRISDGNVLRAFMVLSQENFSYPNDIAHWMDDLHSPKVPDVDRKVQPMEMPTSRFCVDVCG